jgi:hypothetical protein
MGQVALQLQSSAIADAFAFEKIIDDICDMPWESVGSGEVIRIALAYYFFSVQFRENLEIACRLNPNDDNLKRLHREECNTSNLSPWKNIAKVGEAMNHDEFIRRLLTLQRIENEVSLVHDGSAYLALVRQTDDLIRAKSIASYEDGGLARVFSAMLRVPSWQGAGPLAFRHFLEEHIKFDTCGESGHGALSRNLVVDDSILPLWAAFRDILKRAVPTLANAGAPLRQDKQNSHVETLEHDGH